MGLSIEVGMYKDLMENDSEGAKWLEDNFTRLNTVLEENGIEAHVEGDITTPLHNRAACSSFPYSFIHYLRRLYANVVAQPGWQPSLMPAGEDPADDPVLQDEVVMFESHLLCHSDSEGFYVPVRFDQVLFDEHNRIPGGFLCSSHKLYNELVYIAPKMGIELTEGMLSDAEAQRINGVAESDEGFYREYCVWIALFEAARLSIQHRSAICFC